MSGVRGPEGRAFSLRDGNGPVPGCTVSSPLAESAFVTAYVFSLSEGTDISPESYSYPRLLVVEQGELEVTGPTGGGMRTTPDYDGIRVPEGDAILLHRGIPVGTRASNDCIYTEYDIMSGTMNSAIKEGEAFGLGDLVPYRDGQIVNMDVVKADGMKFVVMAFDAGTGLNEHAAPGEAIVFALDGRGIIGYEGKEHLLEKGQCFKFAKGGKHYVKAEQRFKMALLLVLRGRILLGCADRSRIAMLPVL